MTRKLQRFDKKQPNRYTSTQDAVLPYRYDKGNDVLTKYDERTDTYVPVSSNTQPQQPPTPTQVQSYQPPQQLQAQVVDVVKPSATTQTMLRTSYVDKAKGFQVATVPLAVAVGIGAALLAYLLRDTPLLSAPTFVIFWLGFLVVWVAGWVVHNLFSSDGVALTHTLLGWWFVFRQQRERIKHMRGDK